MSRKDVRRRLAPNWLKVVATGAFLGLGLTGCMTSSGGNGFCLTPPTPDAAPVCDEPLISGSIGGTEAIAGSAGQSDARREHVQPYMLAMAAEPAKKLAEKGAIEAIRQKNAENPQSRKGGPGKVVGSLPIGDAVAVAVLSHPRMGAQAARIRGSNADLRFAESGYLPTISAFIGSGHGTVATYSNDPTPMNSAKGSGTWRTDVGVTFKQLIFDFGATRSEVERNRALIDSEKYKLADQAEDIALRTVNAFLNLLEQGELIRLIDQTVVQQRELANIVRLNQQNGNGTKADLDHIQAKIIEIEALRTDIKTAHLTAMDEFSRLTGLRPQQVRRPSASKAMVPATVEMALNRARANNPSMAAISAAGVALNHQLESTRAQRLPKLELQGEALNKHYQGARAFSNGVVDAKVLATLSFKLYDGGMLEAQTDRVRANVEANAFNYLDERETVELNLRRFYLAISSSRAKRAAATQGLTTAESVKTLYTEQFKAGKRTVFELLDSNMLVFAMQRNRISGEFEEMRALYGILRNMGALCEHFARAVPSSKPAEAAKVSPPPPVRETPPAPAVPDPA